MSTLANIVATGLMVPIANPQVPLDSPAQRWGLPMCFTGEPGVGKSERLMAIVRQMGLNAHLLAIPTKSVEDLQGYKVQDGKGGLRRMSDDKALVEIADLGSTVIFLDEINTSRESMRAALLDVLLNRKLGGFTFPGTVRFISAKNPESSSTGGTEFPASLANRFCHVTWSPPAIDEFIDFLQLGETKDNADLSSVKREEEYLQLIHTNWPSKWSTVLGLATGFFKSRGAELLHKIPTPDHPSFSGAWPSNRVWYWAMRADATARCIDASAEVRVGLVHGCVGAGAVGEWLAYEKDADLPSPEEVLRSGYEPSNRSDRNHAVYTAVTNYILNTTGAALREKMAEAAWRIFKRGCDKGCADLLYKPAASLTRAHLGATCKNKDVQEAAVLVMNKLGGFHEHIMKVR